jgi:hypothetical protein
MYKHFNLKDFDDYGTTKTKLAAIFDVSRRTISHYHDLAMLTVEGYYEHFPKVQGKAFTNSPLTPYQCYVLWGIYFQYHVRNTHKVVLEHRLDNDTTFNQQFSYDTFTKNYNLKEIEYGFYSTVG